MTTEEAFDLINNELVNSKQSSSNWADLGCGSGVFTKALARMLSPGSVVHGVDTAPTFEPGMTAKGVELRSQKMDFVKQPLGLSGLDGILMANSLHYVRDQSGFIDGLKKSLSPQGLFLIVEYDTDKPVSRWVPYPLSFSSLTELFKKAGYSKVKKLGERPSVYGRANMYAAIVGL